MLSALVARPDDAEVGVLVRRASLSRFERLAAEWGDRAKPLVGDLTAAAPRSRRRGRRRARRRRARRALRRDLRHHRHEAAQRAANVDGTRAVIEFARRLGRDAASRVVDRGRRRLPRRIHRGRLRRRQNLPTPYHRTKFEAEHWCAPQPGLRYRIYRPGAVVGDSRTGEMDKIDGPYYLFGVLAKLAKLPSFTPMMLPDSGRTNIVPVDYVVDAMVVADARCPTATARHSI